MSEIKTVRVRAPDGTISECEIELSGTPPGNIVFSGIDLERNEFSGDDLFDAFVQLRLELEKRGIKLLCAGCRPDFHRSWMPRRLSVGREGYIARTGAPSHKGEPVDIFDYAEPEKVGSVAQQRDFHQRWVEDLTERFQSRIGREVTSERKAVRVLAPNGEIRDCEIEISGVPPCDIVFSGMDLETQNFTGEDLFDAFIQLRLELEKRGLLLLCAGCRPDVFPSGMSRSMGGGRKAYITHMDAPSPKTDLIDIFDYAGPERVGSVAQQKAFHKKWVESRRKKLERGK